MQLHWPKELDVFNPNKKVVNSVHLQGLIVSNFTSYHITDIEISITVVVI